MSTDLARFLNFLFKTDIGYVYAPLKRLTGEFDQRFFQWPSAQQELTDYINTSKLEGDVYLSPVIWKEKKLSKASFGSSNVAWVEFDGASEISYGDIIKPDAIVQTSSESHVHAYWQIKKSNAEIVENINRRLTYHLRADNSGWDCTQVLRPPETFNHKYAQPIETVLKKLGTFHVPKNPEVFDKAPEIEKPPQIVTYDTLINPEELIKAKKFSKEIQDMIQKESPPVGTRSTFLMRLGYILASAQCTDLEIISILYYADSRIKKFVGRGDQLLRLSEIVAIATLNIHRELEIQGYSPSEIAEYELELEWIVEDWLHNYGIMIVTGQPGVGKTQFSLDLAHKMGTGTTAYGKKIPAPVRVAVLSLEMDLLELKQFVVKQNQVYLKLPNAGLYESNVRMYAPDAENSSYAAFEKIIVEKKPNVIIIDSLSELANEDMKEAEARSIMRWVRKISKENTCAVILIHHNRKAGDGNKKPRKLGDLYGSFIFAKTAGTVISLWDEDKGYIELDDLKVRFGPKGTRKIKRSSNLTFDPFTDDDAKENTISKNPLLNFAKD